MKTTIIIYQLFALLAAIAVFSGGFEPVVELTAVGVVASVLRCLREFYSRLSAKNWENSRLAWFFLRPVVGAVAGGVAYFAIRAFLPSLGVQEADGGLASGFVLLAFVAGFCVDDVLNLVDSSKKKTVAGGCCGEKKGCGCGCKDGCGCGDKDGNGTKSDSDCRCGCGCPSDCGCGCKDGRDCDCGEKNGCGCANVEKNDVSEPTAEQSNETSSDSPATDKKEAV